MSNVQIDSSFLQFSLPTSAQRYLKHFQSSNIIVLLEEATILKMLVYYRYYGMMSVCKSFGQTRLTQTLNIMLDVSFILKQFL